MRFRSLLSVGCVLSTLTAVDLRVEADETAVPPAPAAQSDYEGNNGELTPVAEVFQPGGDPIEQGENPQPQTLEETEESENQIIFDDPAPPKPAPDPYQGLFFDNTFGAYLSNPNNPWLLGERFKEMPLGDECSPYTLSVGGELRHRWMHEQNRLRPNGPVKTDYNLWRWRQYFDLHISDFARVYFEGLDASIFDNQLPPTPIDINRWNIQNAVRRCQTA